MDNPQAFSSEEMKSNAIANAVHTVNAAVDHAANAAANAAAYTAYTAYVYSLDCVAAYADTYAAAYAVDKYFSITGENKQDYIDEILKESECNGRC